MKTLSIFIVLGFLITGTVFAANTKLSTRGQERCFNAGYLPAKYVPDCISLLEQQLYHWRVKQQNIIKQTTPVTTVVQPTCVGCARP